MRKINARNCVIGLVECDCERDFLNINHRQSFASSLFCYGLFFEDELVQLMSFGRPRFNKNYQWEIIREWTKKGCLVRDGTSKLWKHFLGKHSCRSCICYHYPHDERSLFTSHLIDYCDFINIEKAKPAKKIYFEGVWNGERKRIDKSLLVRHGVDRLLKTSQGTDRTNEQILLDLGFMQKEEDGYSPQVDIYYPFSQVYRVNDLTDGSFYIGMTEVEDNFGDSYLGNGHRWNNHLRKHPPLAVDSSNPEAHEYEKIVLKSGFRTPKDTRDFELSQIVKYFELQSDGTYRKVDSNCFNAAVRTQGDPAPKSKCPECGGIGAKHKNFCSRVPKCKECGGIQGRHKTSCSHFDKRNLCKECGGLYGKHKKGCSSYLPIKKCSECGAPVNSHKKTCSFYKKPEPCSECGWTNGHHKKTCSHYKESRKCEECGGSYGKHKKSCSHYKDPGKCPECGYSLKSHKHAPDCSHYKPSKVCEECGGKNNRHKKGCSQYKQSKPCSECGGLCGHHKPFCSKYKSPKICKECHGRNGKHFKTCSKYKNG